MVVYSIVCDAAVFTRRCGPFAADGQLSDFWPHTTGRLESASILLNRALLEFLTSVPISIKSAASSSLRPCRFKMFFRRIMRSGEGVTNGGSADAIVTVRSGEGVTYGGSADAIVTVRSGEGVTYWWVSRRDSYSSFRRRRDKWWVSRRDSYSSFRRRRDIWWVSRRDSYSSFRRRRDKWWVSRRDSLQFVQEKAWHMVGQQTR